MANKATGKPDSAAKRKWRKENTKNLNVNINRNTDAEIFEYLETFEGSYGGLIKRLLKEHIAKEGAKQ